VVHLAELGYESHGVDFSRVALDKARDRAGEAGVSDRCTWIEANLTEPLVGHGQFDLLIDFGTLDDLRGQSRTSMASLITSLAKPGAVFLEWCFYGRREELPWISFRGTSRMSHIAPGELDDLFGADFEIEPFSANPEWRTACFLLTKN
jgi:SAM-dependent methyltransferase